MQFATACKILMGRAKRYGNPKVVIKIIDDCTGANKNVERALKEELGKLIETPRSGDDSAVPETQPLGDDAYSAVLAKLEAYAAAKREIISLHMGGVTANLGAMLRSNGVPVDVVGSDVPLKAPEPVTNELLPNPGGCKATNPTLTEAARADWALWCDNTCNPPIGSASNCLTPEMTGAAQCVCV